MNDVWKEKMAFCLDVMDEEDGVFALLDAYGVQIGVLRVSWPCAGVYTSGCLSSAS